MASNDRLRSALPRAKKTVPDVARAAGVDEKTVYRWLANANRVPHPRTRYVVAKLLGEDEEWLWPFRSQAGQEEAGHVGEVVGAYATRSDVPTALWRELIGRAATQIDLLGYTLYFLALQHTDLIRLLTTKCSEGCRVRAVVGHPESPHVAYRDQEEATPLTLPIRITTTLTTWAEMFACQSFELRFQDVPLYNSIFRFDDSMFVTPHLYATAGSQAPLLHLRRGTTAGLFDRFASHFEAVWAASIASPDGTVPDLNGKDTG
ncbi:hypothetical protein EV385_3665 [Krasilnikovia cinnamomea]|uniref:HTH cro/C1-type domain-containing protein n=1 Tax=Krasilnikovia cinnamomea TaxID=349313 RepID=A0A4Q7ZNG3_9ACTN|nr:helix-turn-helix domain-containing protein [Krasilnikovia cinnamomea]RZU51829.1 hypothetical protein EV385_3665 [Krasilnikovia cinnamomea]